MTAVASAAPICDTFGVQLPEVPVLRLVVQRYAEVLEALKLTPGEQPLVLPTNEWFPDKFTGDQPSFEGLVARMQGYAGLEEESIEAVLIGETDGASCSAGACGSGGCGSPKPTAEGPRLARVEGGYRLEMPAAAVSHPIAFTAAVARLLGHVRLARAGLGADDAVRAELSATALGFGVLLLEASYLYSKSCGGPSIGSATALSIGELAVPLALFLKYEGHKPRAALSELGTTQRAMLDEAWALIDTNRSIVELLKSRPGRVKDGNFELGEARSWLSRLFSGKREKPARDAESLALSALERGDSVENIAALLSTSPRQSEARSERRRKSDDIDSLVDEALSELRGNASSRSAAE